MATATATAAPKTTVSASGTIVPSSSATAGTTNAAGVTNTTDTTGARSYLKDLLDQYGLGSLTNWAYGQLQQGYDDTTVVQNLRQTPEFQSRFKVIFDRQNAGLPAISPADVINYERTATQLMSQFGMPKGFYDQTSDFHDLLMRDVSPAELQSRLQNGYAQVTNGPQEVRDAFSQFYGVAGDAHLAAFFLDPTKAQPVLEQNLLAAQNAGTASRSGFAISKGTAEHLAQMGVSGNAAEQGWQNLNQTRGLYDENFWDQGDLKAEEQGVNATFGLDATSQRQVEQRQRERNAAFAGSAGAVRTNDGVRSAGVADQ